MLIERYIGGGKIFFSNYNGSTYDAEVEIGEVQGANLKISQTYADAYSKDTGVQKKVDKVATQTDSTISFTTQNVSKENMAMAMFGSLESETFEISDTLPDGTVATVQTIIPVVRGGSLTKIEGKVRIVGVNATGTQNPVLVVHHAVLTPDGDVRDYFADKHTTIGFSGEILETADGYFDEYFMAKA